MQTKVNGMRKWSTRFRHHGGFLISAVALALYSYPAWILTGIPGTDDLSNLNVPQRQLLGWFYQTGHWPLWNPFNFAGQPFLAAGQSGPLYLPNLLFSILPTVPALKLSYIFHIILLSIGMYALTWFLTKHRTGALVAAVAFTDSGFLVGHQIHTQMFDAMCWLPWVLLTFIRLQDEFSKRRLATFALVFAGQVFTGHPQIVFYTLFFCVAYAVLMWVWHPTRRGLKEIAWGFCGMILGGLVAAAQLLPTLQLIGYSDRSNVSPGFLLLGSLSPLQLIQFLLPFAAGGGYTGTAATDTSYYNLYGWPNFWEFLPYIGMAVLLLALATAIARFRQDRLVRTITIIGAFSLLLALGSNTFMSWFLTDVPGFDLFRVPARYIGLVDFSIALLAGIGTARLMNHADKALKSVLAVLPVLAMVGLLLFRLWGPYAAIPPLSLWIPFAELAVIEILAQVQLRGANPWPVRTLTVLAVGSLTMETFAVSPFVDWTQGVYTSSSPLTTYIQQHLTGTYPFTRIASLGTTPLMLDRPTSWQIPSVNGYDSLVPTWYVNEVNLTWTPETFVSEPRQLTDALGVQYIVTDAPDAPLLTQFSLGNTQWMHWIPSLQGTYGLKIILSPASSITNPESPLFSVTLKSGSHILTKFISGTPANSYIVNLPDNWPRNQATQVTLQSQNWTGNFGIESLQLLGAHETVLDVNQTFGARVWHPVARFGDIVVWKNPDKLVPAWVTTPSSPLQPAFGSGKLQSWQPNSQTWTVKASHSGIFVISQTYDPSWTATVDGKTVPVREVSGLLTAVPVAQGYHTVVLTYKPRSFQAGLGVSGLALAFCILLLLMP